MDLMMRLLSSTRMQLDLQSISLTPLLLMSISTCQYRRKDQTPNTPEGSLSEGSYVLSCVTLVMKEAVY